MTVRHIFKNEETNIASQVGDYHNGKNFYGFSVILKDLDAAETLPQIKIFKDEAEAIAYAKRITAV